YKIKNQRSGVGITPLYPSTRHTQTPEQRQPNKRTRPQALPQRSTQRHHQTQHWSSNTDKLRQPQSIFKEGAMKREWRLLIEKINLPDEDTTIIVLNNEWLARLYQDIESEENKKLDQFG